MRIVVFLALRLHLLQEGVLFRKQLHQVLVGVPHLLHNGSDLAGGGIRPLQLREEGGGKAAKVLILEAGKVIPVLFRKGGKFLLQIPLQALPILRISDMLNDLLRLLLRKRTRGKKARKVVIGL